MRGIEEQKFEINRRREIYSDMKTLRKKIIAEVSSCVAVASLIVFVVVFIPTIEKMSEQTPVKQYGSMILSLPYMGYVIIAALSFILGIVVTLLCGHIRKRREKEQEIEKEQER